MNNFIKFAMVAVIALGAVGLAYPLMQSQNNDMTDFSDIEPAAGGIAGKDNLQSILQRSYVRANKALEEAQRALEESNNFVDHSMGIQTPSSMEETESTAAQEEDLIRILNDLEPAAGEAQQ